MSNDIPACDIILKAMVSMAAADGRLDTREVSLIQEIYEDCTGKQLTADAIAKAVKIAADSGICNLLSERSSSLDRNAKEEILCASYRVLLADNRVAGEERKRLHDMAKALNVSEIHLSALLEELAATLHE